MNRIIKFGEDVEGYSVPVLNEREVRAAAGILFLATFTSLMYILLNENFVPIKYVLIFFLLDFLIRVFINPKYSPSLIIARLIVSNQTPEYVGAAQKKFAWIIGTAMAGTMFYYFIVLNSYGSVTGIICLLCLVFLFFESAFGICLGCMFYPLFFRKKVQYCPGETCKTKQNKVKQKTSGFQFLVLLVFVLLFLTAFYTMNSKLSEKPINTVSISGTESNK